MVQHCFGAFGLDTLGWDAGDENLFNQIRQLPNVWLFVNFYAGLEVVVVLVKCQIFVTCVYVKVTSKKVESRARVCVRFLTRCSSLWWFKLNLAWIIFIWTQTGFKLGRVNFLNSVVIYLVAKLDSRVLNAFQTFRIKRSQNWLSPDPRLDLLERDFNNS